MQYCTNSCTICPYILHLSLFKISPDRAMMNVMEGDLLNDNKCLSISCKYICQIAYVLLLSLSVLLDSCDKLTHLTYIHKSHDASVPYPAMHHSEQKCAHFCSEWCIVGYETGASWGWVSEWVSERASEVSEWVSLTRFCSHRTLCSVGFVRLVYCIILYEADSFNNSIIDIMGISSKEIFSDTA